MQYFSLAVIADVITLCEMPDTRYGSTRFEVFGFVFGVVGNLNPAVVLYPVETFFHTFLPQYEESVAILFTGLCEEYLIMNKAIH